MSEIPKRAVKDVVSQKVAVSVQFDVVTVELICGDEYAAQVLYDDLVDRLRSGEGLTIAVQQADSHPTAKEDRR